MGMIINPYMSALAAAPTVGTDIASLSGGGDTSADVCILSSTDAILAIHSGSINGRCVHIGRSAATLTAGTEAGYGTVDSATRSRLAALSSTKFVVLYNSSSVLKAKVGTLSGATISYGSSVDVLAYDATNFDVSALDSTHVVAWYNDPNDSTANIGKCVVLTESAGSLTVNTPQTFSDGSIGTTGRSMTACEADSTHGVAVYTDSSHPVKVRVCAISVSGTTITAGTAVDAYSGSATNKDIASFSSSAFVSLHRDGTNKRLVGVPLSLSGTTLTAGTEQSIYQSAGTTYPQVFSLAALDANTGHAYYDDDSNDGKVVRVSLFSNVLTVVSQVGSITSGTYDTSVAAAYDSTYAINCYGDNAETDEARSVVTY